MRTYERALRLFLSQGGPVLRGMADIHVGISELYRERDDPPAAARHLLTSQELGEHTGFAEPVSLAGRDGSGSEAEGNLAWRADLLERGGAPVRERVLPRTLRPVPASRQGSGSRRADSGKRSAGRVSRAIR